MQLEAQGWFRVGFVLMGQGLKLSSDMGLSIIVSVFFVLGLKNKRQARRVIRSDLTA